MVTNGVVRDGMTSLTGNMRRQYSGPWLDPQRSAQLLWIDERSWRMRRWARTVALVCRWRQPASPHLGAGRCSSAPALCCPAGFPATARRSAPAQAPPSQPDALRHLPLDAAAPIAPDRSSAAHHQRRARDAGVARRSAGRTSTRSTHTFPHALLPHSLAARFSLAVRSVSVRRIGFRFRRTHVPVTFAVGAGA